MIIFLLILKHVILILKLISYGYTIPNHKYYILYSRYVFLNNFHNNIMLDRYTSRL